MNHEADIERAWQRQEQFLRGTNAAAAADDPERTRYRRLAHLLSARVEEPPPADLAARTDAALSREQALTARFERNLLFTTLGLFVLVALVSAALYGNEWLADLGPRVAPLQSPWLVALVVIVALSQALDALLRPRRVRPLSFALAAS